MHVRTIEHDESYRTKRHVETVYNISLLVLSKESTRHLDLTNVLFCPLRYQHHMYGLTGPRRIAANTRFR